MTRLLDDIHTFDNDIKADCGHTVPIRLTHADENGIVCLDCWRKANLEMRANPDPDECIAGDDLKNDGG